MLVMAFARSWALLLLAIALLGACSSAWSGVGVAAGPVGALEAMHRAPSAQPAARANQLAQPAALSAKSGAASKLAKAIKPAKPVSANVRAFAASTGSLSDVSVRDRMDSVRRSLRALGSTEKIRAFHKQRGEKVIKRENPTLLASRLRQNMALRSSMNRDRIFAKVNKNTEAIMTAFDNNRRAANELNSKYATLANPLPFSATTSPLATTDQASVVSQMKANMAMDVVSYKLKRGNRHWVEDLHDQNERKRKIIQDIKDTLSNKKRAAFVEISADADADTDAEADVDLEAEAGADAHSSENEMDSLLMEQAPAPPAPATVALVNEINSMMKVPGLTALATQMPAQIAVRNRGDGSRTWAHVALTAVEISQQISSTTLYKGPYSADMLTQCVPNMGAQGGSPLDALLWLQYYMPELDAQVDRDAIGSKPGMPKLTCPPLKDGETGPVTKIKPVSAACLYGKCALLQAEHEETMAAQTAAHLTDQRAVMLVYVDASAWSLYASTGEVGGQSRRGAQSVNYESLAFPKDACSLKPEEANHVAIALDVVTDFNTGKRFWRILPGWGQDFGVGGLIYLPFGENACGLANFAVAVRTTPQK